MAARLRLQLGFLFWGNRTCQGTCSMRSSRSLTSDSCMAAGICSMHNSLQRPLELLSSGNCKSPGTYSMHNIHSPASGSRMAAGICNMRSNLLQVSLREPLSWDSRKCLGTCSKHSIHLPVLGSCMAVGTCSTRNIRSQQLHRCQPSQPHWQSAHSESNQSQFAR